MANDITRINTPRTQQSDSRQSQRVGDDKNTVSSGKGSSDNSSMADKVSLTSTAARLKDIEQRLASHSEMDNARIREVQSAINDGKYDIDADRVADKMINFENSLHS
ncbi:MAG: flagellar biosynthesis anti-sigma factor FlgM [Gammaproteobacteria bacterium]|nr:flagellar biosynthesis anti-sigma factor FlgM [Gammaproteobacteria bacterium]